MADVVAIVLPTSPKSNMISDLPAFIFKRIALTRLYPRANALQGELVLDHKMVLHRPELRSGAGYGVSIFYICCFGRQELWRLVPSQQPCQQAPGEGAEPSTAACNRE